MHSNRVVGVIYFAWIHSSALEVLVKQVLSQVGKVMRLGSSGNIQSIESNLLAHDRDSVIFGERSVGI